MDHTYCTQSASEYAVFGCGSVGLVAEKCNVEQMYICVVASVTHITLQSMAWVLVSIGWGLVFLVPEM